MSHIVVLPKSDHLHPSGEVGEVLDNLGFRKILRALPANEIGLEAFQVVREIVLEFFSFVYLCRVSGDISEDY
jgi:hypothetical protein